MSGASLGRIEIEIDDGGRQIPADLREDSHSFRAGLAATFDNGASLAE